MNRATIEFLNQRREPHFAVFCEIVDGKEEARLRNLAAPGAAALELALLLTKFETEIPDEWRTNLIRVAAGLLALQDEINAGTDDGTDDVLRINGRPVSAVTSDELKAHIESIGLRAVDRKRQLGA